MSLPYLSNWRVFDAPPPEHVDDASQLVGQVALLMGRMPTHSNNSVLGLLTIVLYAIRHKMIKIYYDCDGTVVGYVMWALLAEDVEQRIIDTGQILLHESEWNEGNNLWVIDLLVPYGHIKYVLRDLRDGPFSRYDKVQYLRRKGDQVNHISMVRNQKFGFFHDNSHSLNLRLGK
jgi:hemolysin-activating ACP:hemolysin acyltransferase